jgi:hypothetical protein
MCQPELLLLLADIQPSLRKWKWLQVQPADADDLFDPEFGRYLSRSFRLLWPFQQLPFVSEHDLCFSTSAPWGASCGFAQRDTRIASVFSSWSLVVALCF